MTRNVNNPAFFVDYTLSTGSTGNTLLSEIASNHAGRHALYSIVVVGVQFVVVVLTFKTVLTSIQCLLFFTLQGKETNFRGHKLTRNKVLAQKRIKYNTQRKPQHFLRKKYVTGS